MKQLSIFRKPFRPWECPNTPRHIRIQKLIKAAHSHCTQFIVYTPEKYGPSLGIANQEFDKFFNDRIESAVIGCKK